MTKPPDKYRDRIYHAAVKWAETLERGNSRKAHDAHEDFMAEIDAVIEELSTPPAGGFLQDHATPKRTKP